MKTMFQGGSRAAALLPLAMLALLIGLAALQYRWTGQLGRAEREQLRAGVQSAVSRFADDFDRELSRVVAYLLPGDAAGEDRAAILLERYDEWQEHAPHPELVRELYLVRQSGDATEVAAVAPDARAMTSVRPEALSWIAEVLPPAGLTPRDRRRHDGPRLLAGVPAVVVPFAEHAFRRGRPEPPGSLVLAVAVLDRDYIADVLLPELDQRHFADGNYRVAVRAKHDGEPVYHTDGARGDITHPDAERSLFDLVSGRDFAGLLIEAGHSPRLLDDPGRRSSRWRSHGRRSGRVSSEGRPASAEATEGRGAWVVAATHRSGSLDAAVAAARARNLTISFGILILLAAGTALVLVSARRAQSLARQKMEFVAGVSHELRTPLSVIGSAAQNLADGVTGDPARVREYGRLIRDEGRRLSEMVGQVLEHAAAQSGARVHNRERLSARQVVEAALADCETLIAENGFTVETRLADRLPEIEGDPHALRRALRNLVVNAIKYAGATKWVGVEAVGARGGRALAITVRDRGPGIDPADRGQIFEPFFRGAGAIADQVHGSGLGLSLVRQIVESHGGRVEVESTTGTDHGSAFTLILPVARPGPASSAETGEGEIEQPARG